MMAAASPRLRPLLRALRAQELRAPLWARCYNGGRGLGTQAAAVTLTSGREQQSSLMGQEKTLVGQEGPLVGQQNPLVGQEDSLMGRHTPLVGQKSPLVGQEDSVVGQKSPLVGQEDSLMGQEVPLVGQPNPIGGLQDSLTGQALGSMGQPLESMGQPLESMGQALGSMGQEVRLEDVGLGALTPVGLVQNLLQCLHADVGLPWWAAIAVGTLCVRVSLLPLLLRAQREAARVAPHLPHIQRLANRLQEARRGAEPQRVTRAYAELAAYQQRHNINPLRGFLVPLVQTPVFVSFFLALQQMAAVPLPGFRGGGTAWINDLSCPDPTYALPLLTSATMWMVLEVGAEVGVSTPHAGAVRALLRLLPVLFLPMTVHFPAAIFVYWLTSNSFSLLQTLLLRVPAIRSALRIPAPPPAPPPEPAGSAPKEGLLQRMRNSLAEARATQNAERREWQRRNHLTLAAKGPLRQTFAQNPLAPPAPPAAPAAPKRPWKETLG